MDLKDQLRNLFPDHVPETKDGSDSEKKAEYWMQSEPILCKYEKRNGKPVTVLEGYTGADNDFNLLTRELKKSLNVGGSFKNEKIIIQGNFRDLIMDFLKEKGFKVKRVGG